jgi:hypothetical protein
LVLPQEAKAAKKAAMRMTFFMAASYGFWGRIARAIIF